MVPCHSNTRSRRLYSDFKFQPSHKGQEEAYNTHTHKKNRNIGYCKPDRIKVRVPHSMTEIQGQCPKDCVLAGSKTLEQSERVGRARPWRTHQKQQD